MFFEHILQKCKTYNFSHGIHDIFLPFSQLICISFLKEKLKKAKAWNRN